MRRKIGTIVEEDLLREVKRAAAEDGKRMSDVFTESLTLYLAARGPDRRRAMTAFRRFCENPIRIDPADLQDILDDDPLDS